MESLSLEATRTFEAARARAMTHELLRRLLEDVEQGRLSVGQALETLRELPFADLGFARVDHHRVLRSGIPEVIYGEGKTGEQILAIAREQRARGQGVLVTRLSADKSGTLVAALDGFHYNRPGQIGRLGRATLERPLRGSVALVSAGTADQATFEEAAETLEFLGVDVRKVVDVGVAGLHRLLDSRASIAGADVAIVVAGMEGALASVVGGLVDVPVIAVPTSVGYGSSFGGLAALLSMMTSCVAGVMVVNIDNGFGAAAAAAAILRVADRREAKSG